MLRTQKKVTIIFMAPNSEEIPAKCRDKIKKSTPTPGLYCIADNGGYRVHPTPAPLIVNKLNNINIRAAGSSQKLVLFKRGNAISGAPNIIGKK